MKSSRSTTCTHSGIVLEKRDPEPTLTPALRIVVARNQKERRMRTGVGSERLCKPLPKVRGRVRIVEYVTNAQHGIAPRCGARRRGSSRSHPYVPVTVFSVPRRGTTESAARDASRQCAAASARRLRIRCGDLERRLEQPGHRRRPVTKLVVFVAPFSVNLVLSGFQAPIRRSRLSSLVASGDLRLDPIARGGADNLVTPSPRGPQLFSDARSLPAAHQDFVLDEALKLADGLLEVLLLAFLDCRWSTNTASSTASSSHCASTGP
jgi:hypothetical protein